MTALTPRRKTVTVRAYREKLDDVVLEMTHIPAGSFVMGTPEDEIERLCKEYKQEYFREESPQHLVNISPFYLGRYPITQAQWRVVAGWEAINQELDPNPSRFKEDFKESGDADFRPVEQVSWLDAKEFCVRLI